MRAFRLPRWIFGVYFGLAAILIPWIGYLATVLPQRHLVHNWDLAWVGFDLILLIVVLGAAYLAWRHSHWVVLAASAAASLLVADAWFDVTTAKFGNDLTVALVMALLVELPLAAISLAIAAASLSRVVNAKS